MSNNWQRSKTIWIVVWLVALVLSACGGGGDEAAETTAAPAETTAAPAETEADDPAAEDTSGTEAEDPFAELAAAAEEEGGQLDYYFILGEEALRPVLDAFRERYPFVNIEVTGGDPLELIERIVSEAETGNPVADIIQGGPLEETIINGENDLGMEYVPQGMEQVPEELRFEGQFVVPDYFTFHPIYNTNNVTAEEAPRTLEELTEPEWAGRFGLDAEQLDWFAGELAFYGEEEGLALMEALSANDPQVFAGAAGYDRLAAGSPDVILNTFSQLLVPYLEQDAPMALAEMDHIIAQPDIYIPLANTESPNTVQLYLEWLFTPEAQEVLSQGTAKNPVLGDVAPPGPLQDACGEGCELFFETSENFGDFATRVEQFQGLFAE